MDQDLAQCFVDAACEVLREIGLEVTGAYPLRGDPVPGGERCLIASVGLVGDVTGTLLLRLDTDSARNVVAAMYESLGVANPGEREISETAIAEMANQIGGRAITYLSRRSLECDMTPPAVIGGAELTTALPGITEVVYRSLQGRYGSVMVLLGIKD